ncbi:hypothetical protein PO909_015810 [Leuciscus waleckii]
MKIIGIFKGDDIFIQQAQMKGKQFRTFQKTGLHAHLSVFITFIFITALLIRNIKVSMKHKFESSLSYVTYTSEWDGFWNKNKCRAGLDFVRGELTGWLWFVIGGSDVIDRLLRPHGSKHIIREERGATSLLYDNNDVQKSFIINTAK